MSWRKRDWKHRKPGKIWPDPKYKDEIIMASPAISGTQYAILNGTLQAWGKRRTGRFGLPSMTTWISIQGGGEPGPKVCAGEYGIGICHDRRHLCTGERVPGYRNLSGRYDSVDSGADRNFQNSEEQGCGKKYSWITIFQRGSGGFKRSRMQELWHAVT